MIILQRHGSQVIARVNTYNDTSTGFTVDQSGNAAILRLGGNNKWVQFKDSGGLWVNGIRLNSSDKLELGKPLTDITMAGTWLASGTVTLPAVTFGGQVDMGTQTLNFGTAVTVKRTLSGVDEFLHISPRLSVGTSVTDVGIGISVDVTSTSAIKGYNTIIARQRGNVTSGPSAVQIIGISGEAWLVGTNTQNWTHARGMVGVDGYVHIPAATTGTITGVDAVDASGTFVTGVITTARMFHGFWNAGAANVTNFVGLDLDAVPAGDTITNYYGIRLASVAGRGVTLTRAILTQGGLVEFIDTTQALQLGYSVTKYAKFVITSGGILQITPDTGNGVQLSQSNAWGPIGDFGLDLGTSSLRWSTLYLNTLQLYGGATLASDVTLSAATHNILSSAATALRKDVIQRTAVNAGIGWEWYTKNAANADTKRFDITSGVDTVVVTWNAVTHTGLVLTASQKLQAASGVVGFSVNSSALTLGSAGSMILPVANFVGAANDAARDALAGNIDGASGIDSAGAFAYFRVGGVWKKAALA